MNYRQALSVLGQDFISHAELEDWYDIRVERYSRSDRKMLINRHITKSCMEWCRRNGHIMLPGPAPLWDEQDARDVHLRDLIDRTQSPIDPEENLLAFTDRWRYDLLHQAWARKESAGLDWFMPRKAVLPATLGKSWKSCEDSISIVEGASTAAQLVWSILVCRYTRGLELLKRGQCARTSTVAADGKRLCVGANADGKLVLSLRGDEELDPDLGILPIRL